MQTIRFIDSAFPVPGPVQGVEGFCFYIGGDAYHKWTLQEATTQKYKYALPIWVRSNPASYNGAMDASACAMALTKFKIPKGVLVALDSETSADPSYVIPFVERLNSFGYKVIDYGSASTVAGNKNPDGYYWGADWTDVPHLLPGEEMTQYVSYKTYDESEAIPNLPFWERDMTPKPPPGPWLDAAAWDWKEVIIVGRGENDGLYEFRYDPLTGGWERL